MKTLSPDKIEILILKAEKNRIHSISVQFMLQTFWVLSLNESIIGSATFLILLVFPLALRASTG